MYKCVCVRACVCVLNSHSSFIYINPFKMLYRKNVLSII